MNSADFDTQFSRLTAHFHLPADASRESLGMDWYQAVQGYDVAVLERAVTTLTRTSQDRFWPPLGRVLDLCRGRASGAPSGKCQTCHGSTWIESAPFKSNGMIYDNCVIRCPDCRVPQPQYAPPAFRDGLTALEYREWSQGPNADTMPDGCKGKPWDVEALKAHKAAMWKMFDVLRLKLFGAA